MNPTSSWNALGRRARIGLVAGALLIAAATAAVGWRLLAPDYRVLFADLAPQDAAAMIAELDKQKTPYRVGDDGTTILVDRDAVHGTRIKLMGKDFPLHGAVGFELFNNSDFGMTEFAQKINYQRALQGELTRTILSLQQVRDARVLLVLPEQGLFKQAGSKAKASIALSLKPGQVLRPEQVTGIQRLVSASVAGIAAEDVTLLDQNGVALSRHAGGDAGEGAGSGRLDLKKETEHYLARKADEILERTFGPGQSMTRVDVVLNAERAQITTEDVIAPPGRPGFAPTGVVVRERETMREGAAEGRTGEGAAPRAGSSQRDTEYAVGRRVEQVVSQPGSIRRIQAVAVIRRSLEPAQQEQIRVLLAAAVGASFERGDTVVVHAASTPPLAAPAGADVATNIEALPLALAPTQAPSAVTPAVVEPVLPVNTLHAALAAAGVALAVLVLVLGRRGSARQLAHSAPPALTDAQRQAALGRVQAWLAVEAQRAPETRP